MQQLGHIIVAKESSMPKYPLHKSKNKQAVIALGGSLIAPDEVNTKYLAKFRSFILNQLKQGWRFFIVTGGGAQARRYIDSASEIMGKEITKDDMDWLGIHATRFNAHLVRTIFRDQAQPNIVTNPERNRLTNAGVIIISGWKPGWSTDYVASKIAKRIGTSYIINLSNIDQVYTGDPKKDPEAKPVEKMSWADFREMVGSEWSPRMNVPYDPIAAKLAEKEGQTVLVMGADLKNLKKAFTKGEFHGTVLTKD